jgi:cytochrome c553
LRFPRFPFVAINFEKNVDLRFILLCVLPSLAMMLPAFATPGHSKPPADLKAAPATANAPGDPVAGKAKADDWRCIECHGRDGNGGVNDPEAKIARLAGQYSDYLIKQFRDFRSGLRKNDYMEMVAKNVEDADLVDIAAYFASQKGLHGEARANREGTNPIAMELFNNGDKTRNIEACATCHGAPPSPGKSVIPRIHGQAHGYLERQLFDWRSGERHNGADGFMNLEAKALSNAEIQALAALLSRPDAHMDDAAR